MNDRYIMTRKERHLNTHWWWIEGHAQGVHDGKYDIKACRDTYEMLCRFNGTKKSVETYRAFLRGVRDGINPLSKTSVD